MSVSKRVLWLCLAVCSVAGLWLTARAMANPVGIKAGEDGFDDRVKDATLNPYCPIKLSWQYNGVYYYTVTSPGANCLSTGILRTLDVYPIGCDCTDPIYAAPSKLLPMPKADETADMAPKPDPMFSGVLR
jgi:hypothetical protein